MTSRGVIASSCLVAGLALGVAAGWSLARAVPHGPGQLLRVGRKPPYKAVEIVPESVQWPSGPPALVQTVKPPTRKEARKLERDFGFRVNRDSILGKFDLPPMPDGGSAVATVPVSDSPELVSLIVEANKPPLFRVRWKPRLEGWFGYAAEPVRSGGRSWSAYLGLDDLLCIRDRVCVQARAGRESRPWGEGWVAEAGVSVRF